MVVVGSGASLLGALSKTSSVISFDANELAAYGVENTADLAAFTPNLEIIQGSATTATYFIRGVGLQDFGSNAAGAVAIYLDGVPLNSQILQVAPLFDLEGVSVLRGPQGAGNYRNATGGVISIASRRPNLSAVQASFRSSQGSFYSPDSIDAYRRSYAAAFNVPIVEDLLATRFAFKLFEADPLFTNRCGGTQDQLINGFKVCGEASRVGFTAQFSDPLLPSGLNREVGRKSVYSMRSSWLFEAPTDVDFEILGRFQYSRRKQDGTFGQAIGTGSSGGVGLGGPTAPAGESYAEPDGVAEIAELAAAGHTGGGLAPGFAEFADIFASRRPLDRRPYEGDFNRNGVQRVKILGGSLNMSLKLDNVDLSATTGVFRSRSISNDDTDLIPNRLFELDRSNRTLQVSQDLVATGQLENFPLEWNLGGYFLWEDLEAETTTFLTAPVLDTIRQFTQETFSLGIFAGFSFDLLEDLTLSGGVRFNQEIKEFDITQIRPNFFVPLVTSVAEDLTWREATGTIELLYRFSESASAYVKYNHGYKPGHFNSNGLNGTGLTVRVRDPANPETIDAFEVGMSASYWEDRINFSAALFHYDYANYQVFIFEDSLSGTPSLQILNAESARILGAEFELGIRPLQGIAPPAIDGLELTLSGAWLESEFLKFRNSTLASVGVTFEIVQDFAGNTLANSPPFSLTGGIRWPIDLRRFGQLTPRWDFSWKDDKFFDQTEGIGLPRPDGERLPEYTIGQRAYIIHNLRLTYTTPDGSIELTGWCRNVADERFKTYVFDVSRFRGVILNRVGDPRSCGADLGLSW